MDKTTLFIQWQANVAASLTANVYWSAFAVLIFTQLEGTSEVDTFFSSTTHTSPIANRHGDAVCKALEINNSYQNDQQLQSKFPHLLNGSYPLASLVSPSPLLRPPQIAQGRAQCDADQRHAALKSHKHLNPAREPIFASRGRRRSCCAAFGPFGRGEAKKVKKGGRAQASRHVVGCRAKRRKKGYCSRAAGICPPNSILSFWLRCRYPRLAALAKKKMLISPRLHDNNERRACARALKLLFSCASLDYVLCMRGQTFSLPLGLSVSRSLDPQPPMASSPSAHLQLGELGPVSCEG